MFPVLAFFLFTLEWDWTTALSEAHSWVLDQPYLESVLPLEGYSGVRARSHRDLYVDRHESWFCIDHDLGGRLVAEVRVPIERSIGEQLTLAWLKDRTRSFEEVLPSLELERTVVPASRCPAVARALEELRALEVQVNPEARYWAIHPRVFAVDVAGQDQSARIVASYDEHVVAQWYQRTVKALRTCVEALPETEVDRLALPPPGVLICGTDYRVK